VVPDHTYVAVATVLPSTDGSPTEVIRSDPRALPDAEEVGQQDYLDAASTLIETMSDDLAFILDNLQMGSLGPFGTVADHVDSQAIGAMGWGAGGGAAARLCLTDDRCGALLGLDPWLEPVPDRVVARELQVPSLFMHSADSRSTANDLRLEGMEERSPSVSYMIGIEGARRLDFTLLPWATSFADRLGWSGPIDRRRMRTIVETYMGDFFDRFLQGVGGAALEMPPPPEVEFRTFE